MAWVVAAVSENLSTPFGESIFVKENVAIAVAAVKFFLIFPANEQFEISIGTPEPSFKMTVWLKSQPCSTRIFNVPALILLN